MKIVKASRNGLRDSMGIDVLFNTHHHGDHTGGNAVLIPHSVRSIAHENSKAWQKKLDEEKGKGDGRAYPKTTFRDNVHLNPVNESIAAEY